MNKRTMIIDEAITKLNTKAIDPALNSKADMMTTMMAVKLLLKQALRFKYDEEHE